MHFFVLPAPGHLYARAERVGVRACTASPFCICRQALEGKLFMGTSMLTIRFVLSLIFRATVQAAPQAAVAPWRSKKWSHCVDRKDEDNHCVQHADIPTVMITASIQPISPPASTGITDLRTMSLSAGIAAAL